MDNETTTTMMKKKKRTILKPILVALLSVSFLFFLFVAYGSAIPNQFYKLLVVTSGSMSPTFEAGDLIMVIKSDPEKIKANDIITFQTKGGALLTHRVVEIKSDGEIITKGDANKVVDSWSNGWKLGKAEAIYVGRIPVYGKIIYSIQGLFAQDTGAWLKDTETISIDIEAGTWEQEPELTPESIEMLVPILIPEQELIPEAIESELMSTPEEIELELIPDSESILEPIESILESRPIETSTLG